MATRGWSIETSYDINKTYVRSGCFDNGALMTILPYVLFLQRLKMCAYLGTLLLLLSSS